MKLKAAISELERKYNGVSNIRLTLFLITILLFGLSIFYKKSIWVLLFLASCFILAAILYVHDKISTNIKYLREKYKVHEKRRNRMQGKWNDFKETGEEFLKKDSQVEQNLDILGENSLYQYLCVANTNAGKEKLADFLTKLPNDLDSIKKRQQAVKELIEQEEFSLELETRSSFLGRLKKSGEDKWYQGFLKYLERKDSLLPSLVNFSSWFFPILTALAFLLYFKGILSIQVPVILLGLQGLTAYYISVRTGPVTKDVYYFCYSVGSYFNIIKLIEKGKFESAYLKDMQEKFLGNSRVSKGIIKLEHLNEAFTLRNNFYIHFILQLVTMFDIHCIRSLDNWKRKYAAGMQEVFMVIGEFEALLSLSMMGIYGDVSFPDFSSSDRVLIEGKGIKHPLINKDKVVANSYRAVNGVDIITGSNMSGKTTFMRTIGVNVVLAYAGAPVKAEAFRLTLMKLFTSMRVTDDVSKGISSFYGEVLRIKEMVEFAKEEKPMLVLIDEIFKGTNSADRIIGAKEVLKTLNKKHILALVSTHDFELCNLIDDRGITGHNYHFEEHYEEDKILFDYTLKDGRCKTTNARYILKMAGLM